MRITNLNSVDSILADFKEKVDQLNALAARRLAAIDKRTNTIQQLVGQNGVDQHEADNAYAAANKIKQLFN